MRIEAFLLLVILVAVPGSATERVTVTELEQAVAGSQDRSDARLARRIGDLELTERLSPARFRRLDSALPGRKSHQALVIVAGTSAFLDLPGDELPLLPPPDQPAQAQIISRAVDFVSGSIHRMPAFTATRRITRFEALQVVRGIQQPVITHDHPMHFIGRGRSSVEVRQGLEYVRGKPVTGASNTNGLTNWGIFGPLLSMVTADLLNGNVAFDHWEAAPGSPAAVFRFAVSQPASHYAVTHCCFTGRTGLPRYYRATPQYHGELAIEPASGAVLRLMLKTDLGPDSPYQVDMNNDVPLARADVAVEFAVVEIGGAQYICPLHSVSLAVSWTQPSTGNVDTDWNRSANAHLIANPDQVRYTRLTAMNDIRFDHHHAVAGSMRILPVPPLEVH